MLLSYVFQGFCNLEKFFLFATTCSLFVNDVREGLWGRDRTKTANIFSSERTHFFEVYSLSPIIMEVENHRYTKRKESKIGDVPFPTSMIMGGRVFLSSHVLFGIFWRILPGHRKSRFGCLPGDGKDEA